MYKFKPSFQKLLFDKIIKAYGSSLKAQKILKIPASSIRGYKNLYFNTLPEELSQKIVELKLVSQEEIDNNILEKLFKEDLIEKTFNIGRRIRKEKLLKFHNEIPLLNEIFNNDNLDVLIWFNKYKQLLNSGFRKVSVESCPDYLKLSYSNFNGSGFKEFTVNLPQKFKVDEEFSYFFGLWCGDRVGGKRFGICNKNKEILDFTENFLAKNFQNSEKILFISKGVDEPKVLFDKKFILNNHKKGWVLTVHSNNGVLSSFFHYLQKNLGAFLTLNKHNEAFFAGLFDAEGNVSLHNKSFRWACKNLKLVKIYSKFLKNMKLFNRYDGDCLISYNRLEFFDKILPHMRHNPKMDLTKFMINGHPLPPEYLLILEYLRNNPKSSQKLIAKALKKTKIYSELKLLDNFGFISSSGHPLEFKITPKGLNKLGEKITL